MGCEEWSEPISAYVDGEASAAERARIAEHLLQCPDCRSAVERAEHMRRRHLLGDAGSSDDLREAILAAHDDHTTVRTRLRRRAAMGIVASSLAILGGAAALSIGGSGGPGGPGDSLGSAASGGAGAVESAAHLASADHEVVVDALADHSTHELHIRAGETVAWRNDGADRHALVHDIDGSTVVGSLDPGQSEAITFASPGSYAYQCAIHEGISGEVHVTT